MFSMCYCFSKVILVAELTEMFSQVNTVKQDRQYHRLLWKGLDLSRPPEVYEAMRLMFVYPPHLALPSTLCKNIQRTTYMTIF